MRRPWECVPNPVTGQRASRESTGIEAGIAHRLNMSRWYPDLARRAVGGSLLYLQRLSADDSLCSADYSALSPVPSPVPPCRPALSESVVGFWTRPSPVAGAAERGLSPWEPSSLRLILTIPTLLLAADGLHVCAWQKRPSRSLQDKTRVGCACMRTDLNLLCPYMQPHTCSSVHHQGRSSLACHLPRHNPPHHIPHLRFSSSLPSLPLAFSHPIPRLPSGLPLVHPGPHTSSARRHRPPPLLHPDSDFPLYIHNTHTYAYARAHLPRRTRAQPPWPLPPC